MLADALAPQVARASSGMVLALYGRQHVPEIISFTWVNSNQKYNSKCEPIFYNI